MKRAVLRGLTLAALLAAGAGGYWAGHRGFAIPGSSTLFATTVAAETPPPPSGPVIYYKDPDGRPAYSAAPTRTTGGRAFLPVRASEEGSFEETPPADAAMSSAAMSPGTSERRILYYRNPMGLPDTSPVPKKDGMGMDYIPVYDDEAEDGPVVKIPPGRLQRTGVRTQAAERRPLDRRVRVPGMVQLDERRIAVVATRSPAFLDAVANVTTGDRVVKGQALARLYAPDIATAGAQYVTDLNGGARGASAGGGRQRLENLGVPAEAIAEIERTRKVPLSMTWRAMRDGVVLERNAVDGMRAEPGAVLFRIADISTLWVLADVPEHDLGAVRIGAPASVRVRGRPGVAFDGQVSLVYPQVSEATRTAHVRIEIANPDGVLLPNMYADVAIGTGDAAPVLAVPDDAVIDTGMRQVVILERGEGRFEPREVKVGRRGEGFIEIRDGLAEGDLVVVAANFLIDAESNLKAALRGLAPVETQP
ncbi:efflux RND transporter periplasmic adaptor subunit [Xanthobacter autotrophicus]|uniref:Efflux transporter, RND family, MFP subunit n=1 Tax=Xanthobacter autotrophicus (strain ATCC BAA-1158 / Py2) TaxID=78245 RepID=A7IP67_XANP2|nr:efflux transporter, RND family, MFP subunit [Xanthobacter autotrophicus Py2]